MTDVAGDPSAELARLTLEVDVLTARAEHAWQVWAAADAILHATRWRRDQLADSLRGAAPAPAGVPAPGQAAGPRAAPRATGPAAPRATGPAAAQAAGPAPRAAPPAVRAGETSTRTVQNVLFILGGLLLGTAAVVFTAVAWAAYGVAGRALILAVVTVLALAAPLVALRRRLTATAETFAAVGLLLVVLDGYAAWYVNLLDVNTIDGSTYAAAVCAGTAAVAAGYRAITKLVGPAFAAIVAAQPVVPLLAVASEPDPWGWTIVFAGVAVGNLLAVAASRRGTGAAATGVRVLGWTFTTVALASAAGLAVAAEVIAGSGPEAARAGAATAVVALVFAGSAALTRSAAFHALAGCGLVLATIAAAGRFADLAWPDRTLVAVAATVAAMALLGVAGRRLTPAPARPGVRAGVLVAAGALAVPVTGMAGLAAIDSLAPPPVWSGDLSVTARFDWQLLAAVGLAAVALVASVARGAWRDILAIAGVLAVLALPGSVALAWWVPPVLDVGAATILAGATVLLAGRWRPGAAPAIGAALLTAHAVGASLTRPELTAAILGSLVVAGVAIAMARGAAAAAPASATAPHGGCASEGAAPSATAPDGGTAPDGAAPDAGVVGGAVGGRTTRAVAGFALAVGLVALPPAVGSWLVAIEAEPAWALRLTTASVVVVLAALGAVRRWRADLTWYALAAALISAMSWPVVGAVSGVEPAGIYAALGLVAIAACLLGTGRDRFAAAAPLAGAVAAPGLFILAANVLAPVAAVVALPYAWIGAVWSGVPAGVGLAPASVLDRSGIEATAQDAVALGLLAAGAAIAAYAATGRIRSAIGGLGVGGPAAILVALTAAAAPWPTVPTVTLALGVGLLMIAALAPVGRARAAIAATQGVAYVGAGLAGALTVEWSTLAALSSIVVAATVVGTSGRTAAWRVGGLVTAVAAALTTAAAAGFAAELTPRVAAFPVLAVAALALAGGTTLDRGTALGRGRVAADGSATADGAVAGGAAAGGTVAGGAAPDGTATPARNRESVAVQAAAHAGAVVALALTAGHARHAAAVCAVWGIAVGVRALWPGTSTVSRRTHAAAGAAIELLGWWLLLASNDVALVEAYTIPMALVALLAGWAALRARPELRSAITYGPALCAAFLPSLATTLGAPGEPWRRLLLFLGAIAVLIAGSVRRLKAPVVVGGSVLALVALHELVLFWDLVPRWIPLAIGGLLLVGLAITYERRLRDLARIRGAVARMH